jgi:hypothetical protein
MLPLIREKTPETKRPHSAITTLLGFVLGMFVMYCTMLPNDSPHSPVPQESYKLVFDESALENVRTSADVSRCIVRMPIPKPIVDQTQWQYGVLRESLLRL